MRYDMTSDIRRKIEDLEESRTSSERFFQETEEIVAQCGQMSRQREALYQEVGGWVGEDSRLLGILHSLQELSDKKRREEKQFLQKVQELGKENRDRTDKEIRQQYKMLSDLYAEEETKR